MMLTGALGSGKRATAVWLARRRLGLPARDLPEYPVNIPVHADLRWIRPPEDKHTIGVDQVRELVAEVGLTSYEGRGKVAVIEPADAMTTNAANSLLKTLEEPPGDTLLVLVADRPGQLPATIFSRCQRLNVRLPGESEALAWLQKWQPGSHWAEALNDGGSAPLAAIDALQRLELMASMRMELAAVGEGRAGPLEIAERWSKEDPRFVLGWLGRQVQACILRLHAGPGAGVPATVPESVLERIDRKNLFCYLDIINGLRSQPAGSYNVQLTLECLLIDWAQRLESLMGTE